MLLLGLLALLVGKEGEVDRVAVALRKRVLNHCWMPRMDPMPTVKVAFELVVISAGTELPVARSEVMSRTVVFVLVEAIFSTRTPFRTLLLRLCTQYWKLHWVAHGADTLAVALAVPFWASVPMKVSRMISVYGIEPEESGISVVMVKTNVLGLMLAPEGNIQLQRELSPFSHERDRYSVIDTHEEQTARVSYCGHVQFPVGQSTVRAFDGSAAENIPL